MKSLFNVLLISTLAFGSFVTALKDLATDSSVTDEGQLHVGRNPAVPEIPYKATSVQEGLWEKKHSHDGKDSYQNKQSPCCKTVLQACGSGGRECNKACNSIVRPCQLQCATEERACEGKCDDIQVACDTLCTKQEVACNAACFEIIAFPGATDPLKRGACRVFCEFPATECRQQCVETDVSCVKACCSCDAACDAACVESDSVCRASCDSGELGCRYKAVS